MCSCCLKLWRQLEMPLKIYLYVCKDASNVTLDSKIIPKRYWNNQKSWLLPPEYTFFFLSIKEPFNERCDVWETDTTARPSECLCKVTPAFQDGKPWQSARITHTLRAAGLFPSLSTLHAVPSPWHYTDRMTPTVRQFLVLYVCSENNRSIGDSYFKEGKRQVCTQQMSGYFRDMS